ncbi:MAG: methyltransferase domain-containing protein [Chloroflexales bacterium]|nr:methyltransferase domain-containing protein [Chloroflexales bacterium]
MSIFQTQYYIRFIRWSFARFYREFAWTYDTVAWLVSRGLWRRWTLAALPYISGRILELGCGTGYVQSALAQERPGSAVGLDASPQMLALTRQRADHCRLDLRLLRAVAQALPFASASFDSVLATFPAEYILHPATGAEIRRVLVPNGRLVIIDAAQFSRSGLYERVVDLAYRFTLQSSVRREPADTPYLQKLDTLGFHFEMHWEQVGPSRVMVLVGKC